jgi:hypothetical protein
MQNRRWSTVLFLILLVSPVLFLVWSHYEPKDGFLSIIRFGSAFEHRQLPEVRAIAPPVNSEFGYDGQFYAQMAIAPSLQHPGMRRSIDAVFWRGKRIGLSAIAYTLGLGQPRWILQVYALLNFAFWLGLLALLLHPFDLHRLRTKLMVAAILLSSGTLISIDRALIDLPALFFSLLPVLFAMSWAGAAVLFAFAILTKETAVLSAPALLWIYRAPYTRLFETALVIGLIPICWYIYVLQISGLPKSQTATNLLLPFEAFIAKFGAAGLHLQAIISTGRPRLDALSQALFELLAPVSFLVQAAYFFVRYSLRDKYWLFGIGFALLFCLLGAPIWFEQAGYTRILLPLTAAFNLLIHQRERHGAYLIWWITGNLGMFGMLIYIVIQIGVLIF